jgi:2-polyprenyl-3-methyl-5-hydroxy-6-metoxy-1,4-benzoquinol methylase
MDLACGFTFSTRLLKQHGAAQVIGVDISPEMIRLATQQEQAEPLGITYQVCDSVVLPRLGPFDLVTAVYLLNYATSADDTLSRQLPARVPGDRGAAHRRAQRGHRKGVRIAPQRLWG